jgi:hypothetical protein
LLGHSWFYRFLIFEICPSYILLFMLFPSYDNRHNTIVALKDQVMQIGGGDRPQCWELGRSIGIAEDVEGPNPHGSAAQVRVVEIVSEECLQGNGRDTSLFLLGPGERPESSYISFRRFRDTAGSDSTTRQQQGIVDLAKRLPGIGVKVVNGGDKELLLVGPVDSEVAMSAIAQVGKVSQKPPQVVRRSIDVTCSSDVHPAHLPLLSAYYFHGYALEFFPKNRTSLLRQSIHKIKGIGGYH